MILHGLKQVPGQVSGGLFRGFSGGGPETVVTQGFHHNHRDAAAGGAIPGGAVFSGNNQNFIGIHEQSGLAVQNGTDPAGPQMIMNEGYAHKLPLSIIGYKKRFMYEAFSKFNNRVVQ
jgi:hypothetical protein